MIKYSDAGQEVLQRERLKDKKYPKFHHRFQIKSKKQRQNWWKNLTPEQQISFIDKKVAEKALKRQKKSIKLMKQHKIHHNCNFCLHRKTQSCTNNLPDGCEYYVKLKKVSA